MEITKVEGPIEYQGFDAWAEKFKPINNKFTGGDVLRMFETYGEEYEYVKSQDPKYVWTWVTGDMCDLLIPGFNYVNRFGYYICEIPWENDMDSVLLSVERECDCYDEEAWDNGEREDAGDPDCEKCEGYGLVTEYVG